MEPQLVIDKSTLQSLSYDEVSHLNIHYHVVYAPVLFIEILGDLKKFSNSEKSKSEVKKLAEKISGMGDGSFTANYRFLLYNELMGYSIDMSYRPILLGGRQVITKDGQKSTYFDEQPEYKALGRWQEGKFSEAEESLSDSWRLSTRAIDLESWLKVIQNNQSIPKLHNYNELLLMTEKFIREPSQQHDSIQLLLYEAGFSQEDRNNIFGRWLKKGMPSLKDFAPYAFYCLKVFVAFYLGVVNRLIGTKATNRIDLEYLLYLPFCRIFSSTDKFLRDFGPCFLDNNQDFIWGNELKDDMQRISQHWDSLTDEQKSKYRSEYGSFPFQLDDSITYKLWMKHWGPPKKKTPLTPEREKEIMKKIKPFLDAIEQKRKTIM